MRGLTFLLSLLAWGVSTEAARAQECLDDWSTAAPIVKREGLLTVEQISGLLRARDDGAIVKASLCEGGGRYSFRLVVRAPSGKLRTLEVDAREPFKP